jgi:hypothetical protein
MSVASPGRGAASIRAGIGRGFGKTMFVGAVSVPVAVSVVVVVKFEDLDNIKGERRPPMDLWPGEEV